MGTDYLSSAGDGSDDPAALLAVDDLRERVRARLRRHLEAEAFAPALTVIGFSSSANDVLRVGIDRPEDAVLDFVLPSQYSGLGVLASSVVATPPQRAHQEGALGIGVSRDAQVVSLLATRDEVITTSEPRGWLIDACLRAVALPTSECTVAALAFPIALWLDRLMVALLHDQAPSGLLWSNAVDLCPIPHRWRSLDPVDLGTTLGSTTRSWKRLRAAAVAGSRSPVGISPERAGWMDDAMFARWCLGAFPDLPSLRGDVEFLAPAPVAERVEIALRAAWLAFAS